MDKFVFESLLKDMAAFYERTRPPAPNSMAMWYEKVKNIPPESLNWIKNKIFEENEMFPRNVSSTLWSCYHQWLDAYPEKRAHTDTFTYCPDCFEGLISAWKEKSELTYRYIFRCKRCRQNDIRACPEAYKNELALEGYEFTPPKPKKRPKRGGNIAKAIEIVVEPIDDVPF